MSLAIPSRIPLLRADLVTAFAGRDKRVRKNDVIPIIIVIAIIVLLLIAVSIVAAAIILCAEHGGVLDTVINLKNGYVKVVCHKI